MSHDMSLSAQARFSSHRYQHSTNGSFVFFNTKSSLSWLCPTMSLGAIDVGYAEHESARHRGKFALTLLRVEYSLYISTYGSELAPNACWFRALLYGLCCNHESWNMVSLSLDLSSLSHRCLTLPSHHRAIGRQELTSAPLVLCCSSLCFHSFFGSSYNR